MAAYRRKGVPRPLGELVPRVYPAHGQQQTIRVFGWWSRAVPRRVVEHARPVRLHRGVLTVHVSSPAWAQELHFLRERLLAALSMHAPESGVRDIRFRVGPLPDTPVRRPPPAQQSEPEPVETLPEDLARALARLQDDELRQTIARAASVSLGKKR